MLDNKMQHDIAILRRFGDRYKLTYFKRRYRPRGLVVPPLQAVGDEFRDVLLTPEVARSLVRLGMMSLDDYEGLPAITVLPEKVSSSFSRARAAVYELGICNPWQYFITLTLDPLKFDRFALPHYRAALSQFLRDQRKKWGGCLSYLLVPEQHRDGAWHMHGMLGGVASEMLRPNEHGYLDWPDYRRRFGYFSASVIRSPERCAAYVVKYVSKSLAVRASELGAHLYYASQGLARSEVVAIGTFVPPLGWRPDYENEYVFVAWGDAQSFDVRPRG